MRRSTKEGLQFAGIGVLAFIVWALLVIASIAIPVVIIVTVLQWMGVL